MLINNLNNSHLTEEEKTEIRNALIVLENAIRKITVNLTAEERKIYGRVNEKNKLLINKVWDFRRYEENLSNPDIDWEEFQKDYDSRVFLEGIIDRIMSLYITCKNAKTLHDYDNYKNALKDYSYTRYKASSNTSGFEVKRAELKQFFVKKNMGNKAINNSNSES
jgi:hypothetical protein